MVPRRKLVVMRDAIIKHRKREFVFCMGPREIERLAPTKDAIIKLRKEEFVLNMVLKVRVVIKDATGTFRREGFVLSTVPRRRLAAIKDVRTK